MFDGRTILGNEALSHYESDPRLASLFFISRIPSRMNIARLQRENKHIIDVKDENSTEALKDICNELLYRIDKNGRENKRKAS